MPYCTKCGKEMDASSSGVCQECSKAETYVPAKKKAKKKSLCLLISAFIGIAYMIYGISYWSNLNATQTDASGAIGAGIATALVIPHMICAAIALIFNILAWAMDHRGFALTAGILYAVSIVLFFAYFMFVIVEMILCFVGYARLKKINQNNAQIAQ